MSNEVSFPTIYLVPGKDGLYENHGDVVYNFDGKSITVPDGYKYDGASIPRMFWRVMGTPYDPDFMAGALPHDRCYTTHELPKEWADRLLKAVLLANGVSSWKVNLIYSAVKYFGGGHWKA